MTRASARRILDEAPMAELIVYDQVSGIFLIEILYLLSIAL